MSDNASTSPGTSTPGKTGGPNKLGVTSAPLVNEVIRTNDTQMVEVPTGGTVESDFGKWMRS